MSSLMSGRCFLPPGIFRVSGKGFSASFRVYTDQVVEITVDPVLTCPLILGHSPLSLAHTFIVFVEALSVEALSIQAVSL